MWKSLIIQGSKFPFSFLNGNSKSSACILKRFPLFQSIFLLAKYYSLLLCFSSHCISISNHFFLFISWFRPAASCSSCMQDGIYDDFEENWGEEHSTYMRVVAKESKSRERESRKKKEIEFQCLLTSFSIWPGTATLSLLYLISNSPKWKLKHKILFELQHTFSCTVIKTIFDEILTWKEKERPKVTKQVVSKG